MNKDTSPSGKPTGAALQVGCFPEGKIPVKFKIGNQTVRSFTSHDPIGDRYSIVFGSTNHLYDINVSFGGPFELSHNDFAEILRRSSALRHPCLVPYFACGDDNGVIWLRSAHSAGVSAQNTATSGLDDHEELSENELADEDGNRCFTTLRSLLNACGGNLEDEDRNLIIGDLAEALAFLHSNGAYAGTITPETIFLDRVRRHSGMIAKLRFYNWPATATPELIAKDLSQAGEIIALLVGAGNRHGSQTAQKLIRLSEQLRSPLPEMTGMDFLSALTDTIKLHRTPRHLKKTASDTAKTTIGSSTGGADPDDAGAATGKIHHLSHQGREQRRVRRHKKTARSGILDLADDRVKKAVTMFAVILVFAAIILTAFGIYYGVKYFDHRRILYQRLEEPRGFSPVTVLDAETGKAFTETQINVDYFTADQLQAAVVEGDSAAAARLCVTRVLEAPSDLQVRAESIAVLTPLLENLESRAQAEPSAAYWRACAIMLAIAGEPDYEAAVSNLQSASSSGHINAKVLLGDWYATRRSVPNTEDDRKALSLWLEASGAGDSETRQNVAGRIIKFVREGRGFNKGDTAPVDFIRSVATGGTPEAMMMMADVYEEGIYVEQSYATALSWLRDLASNMNAAFYLRSEAQRRMAEMFAVGRGSPQSDTAARTWYARAASLGNAEAMKAFADFLETGRGGDEGESDPEAVKEWRLKAETAAPPPAPEDTFKFIAAVRTSAAVFNDQYKEQ